MTIRKRYDLPLLQTANETVKETVELDKGTQRVTGILLTSDRDDMLFHRGTIEIQLSGCEIFPEGYACKLLMSGLGVAPKDRYLPLDMEVGSGELKVKYSDANSPVQTFGTPYTVSVYLETEMT